MKNIKVFIWFSLFILLIPTLPARAAVNETVVGVSSAFIEKTGAVEIAVFISGKEKIAGGSLDIVYNSEYVRVNATDIKITDTLSPYLSSASSDPAGKVSMAFAKVEGSLLNGTIMHMKTAVVGTGSGKVHDLTLENVELYDEQGKKIQVQLINGQMKPFVGNEITYEDFVTNDKSWIITVSKPYNPATLNERVASMKMGTKEIEIEIEVISDKKFKIKPVGTYARGTYTMDITEQLRSVNGARLSQPVRFTFKVK